MWIIRGKVEQIMGLQAEQIAQFEREGLLIVEDLLSPQLLADIQLDYQKRLAGLVDGWHADGLVPDVSDLDFFGQLETCYERGLDWFQPMDISLPGGPIQNDTPFHFSPAVFNLLTHAPILDAVESLIGPEITSNPIQHVRIKPPVAKLQPGEIRAHVGGTDWHQDRAVAHAEADATQMVTVWVAITDATVDNSCLQAVTGKPQVYPHCPKRQASIAEGYLDKSKAVPLPVKAGGAVLFHPLTPHSSLDNKSDGFRWSFDLRYNVTGEPTGRSHFPEFIARSRIAPVTELRDWQAWRAMWERARDRLAQQPHIPIHRWQADSPACA